MSASDQPANPGDELLMDETVEAFVHLAENVVPTRPRPGPRLLAVEPVLCVRDAHLAELGAGVGVTGLESLRQPVAKAIKALRCRTDVYFSVLEQADAIAEVVKAIRNVSDFMRVELKGSGRVALQPAGQGL